ncbi:Isochorismatase hydrolase [Trichoderma citrinoviride]|uniref:Isochorismatase hydrolase n=1 Tax=Trichoderma citrinoviride TaxID=58853 RepID=A0A2T4B701_9HYPO|nr:Isochorismatase hydrolase [Trichoderma citrinoviride]PTB65009.1 Isochorismatase hydrolase [Trichoderma citrinoviride]
MKFFSTAAVALASLSATVMASRYPYERLDKDKAVLLVVDLQVGLYNAVRDFDPVTYKESIIAHAAIGKLFDLPVILTTSAEQGPNGPLPKEITEMYPNSTFIKRQGEVDAWDNPDFQAAVKATNKTQIIMAGIVTDVCTTHLALSLRDAGYSVWANAEASGTSSTFVREIANDRMRHAGVQIVSLFSIVCDLMRDWRNVPGAAEVLPYLDQYFPVYGMVARAHAAAKTDGVIQPGEAGLI